MYLKKLSELLQSCVDSQIFEICFVKTLSYFWFSSLFSELLAEVLAPQSFSNMSGLSFCCRYSQ